MEHGLTHSRLPLSEEVIEIVEVKYPKVVAPGEKFYPEITVLVRTKEYPLRESKGDFLSNIDASDENLFGAHPLIPVKGEITQGNKFTFVDYDNPFVAPELAEGEEEREFMSTWRVWMWTRYVGAPISIVFRVK